MKFVRGSTLLPLSPEDIRTVSRVPWRQLPAADLLLYDDSVSDFFFEFDPEEEIDRFIQHAHFGCRSKGDLIACVEEVEQVVSELRLRAELTPELFLPFGSGELPAPLRFVPHRPAFEEIRRTGSWRGRITCCSCGIAGCFSQYAWLDQGICLFLFTVNGATLEEVECLPFRVADIR